MTDKQKAEPIINHKEALELAHMKREESNLARCYIELRKAIKTAGLEHMIVH